MTAGPVTGWRAAAEDFVQRLRAEVTQLDADVRRARERRQPAEERALVVLRARVVRMQSDTVALMVATAPAATDEQTRLQKLLR